MFNNKKQQDLLINDFLSSAAINPNLVGPTLPPIPPFTLPTGPTGIESAFRAIKTTDQSIIAGPSPIITFETTQYDLNGEYDGSSTFIPKQDGVYLIISTLLFTPTDQPAANIIAAFITVNNIMIAADDSFIGTNTGFLNVVTVSTIIQLQAGDTVLIQAASNINGTIPTGVVHFEAARFPSPAPNPIFPINPIFRSLNERTIKYK
ncbi:exosporium leader peptide-containing protein [Bacillus cereus]|uniref:Exosporium leader peptide n=1 Tax=Bacillus cereus TaxID=1396 RepID=A0A2B9E7I6_BACCE|nr:exosporium leader peptide-containing protein [Bacillus cereus]PGM96024.1 exosporium leader peptide [Bacillus cereus]